MEYQDCHSLIAKSSEAPRFVSSVTTVKPFIYWTNNQSWLVLIMIVGACNQSQSALIILDIRECADYQSRGSVHKKQYAAAAPCTKPCIHPYSAIAIWPTVWQTSGICVCGWLASHWSSWPSSSLGPPEPKRNSRDRSQRVQRLVYSERTVSHLLSFILVPFSVGLSLKQLYLSFTVCKL